MQRARQHKQKVAGSSGCRPERTMRRGLGHPISVLEQILGCEGDFDRPASIASSMLSTEFCEASVTKIAARFAVNKLCEMKMKNAKAIFTNRPSNAMTSSRRAHVSRYRGQQAATPRLVFTSVPEQSFGRQGCDVTELSDTGCDKSCQTLTAACGLTQRFHVPGEPTLDAEREHDCPTVKHGTCASDWLGLSVPTLATLLLVLLLDESIDEQRPDEK